MVAEHDRCDERVEQTLRDLDRPALAGQPLAEHSELVAAHARERVAGGEQRREPLGELGQQLVAAIVAEELVDDLEAVEAQPEHCDGAAVAGRERERVVDAVDEQQAVRQRGQRVVECAVLGLLLESDHPPQRVVEPTAAAGERSAAHHAEAAAAVSGSCRFISARKAATTIGSNWLPAQRSSSSNAAAAVSGSRHGRTEVMAS